MTSQFIHNNGAAAWLLVTFWKLETTSPVHRYISLINTIKKQSEEMFNCLK